MSKTSTTNLSQTRRFHASTNHKNYFDAEHSVLDRASDLRESNDYLQKALNDPQTRFILFYKNKPVVQPSRNSDVVKGTAWGQYELSIMNSDRLKKYREKLNPLTLFLGVELSKSSDVKHDISTERCTSELPAWFAIDTSKMTEQELGLLVPNYSLGNFFPEMLQLNFHDASLLSQALPLMQWIHRYKYCTRCGSKFKVDKGGHKLSCTNDDCRSNKSE